MLFCQQLVHNVDGWHHQGYCSCWPDGGYGNLQQFSGYCCQFLYTWPQNMWVRATGGLVLENTGSWVIGLAVVHWNSSGFTFVTAAAASVARVSTVTTLTIALNSMLVVLWLRLIVVVAVIRKFIPTVLLLWSHPKLVKNLKCTLVIRCEMVITFSNILVN